MGKNFLRVIVVVLVFGLVGLVAPLVRAAPDAPPANDNFVNAQVINGSSGVVTGTTVAATKEAGEPNHAGYGGGKSVWYTWVAPGTGAILFTTYGSSFDTLLGVYTGVSVNALTEVASNDECGAALTSCVVFNAMGGTTYWVAVDGYGGASGNIRLEWAIPPANDVFANASFISGTDGALGDSIAHATKEPGEPNHGGAPGGASVWYQWTAPSNVRVRFALNANSFTPVMGIYTGSSVNALTKAADGRACGSNDYADSCMVFDATNGTTYYIAVDAAAGTQSGFGLTWGVTPANDDFENAQVITGASGSVNGSTNNATAQPGDPYLGYYDRGFSVWYQWTAPSDGWYRLQTPTEEATTTGGVFTGTHLEELVPAYTEPNCETNGHFCEKVYMTGGEVYSIELDSDSPHAFSLSWRPLAPPPNDDFANAQTLSTATGSVNGTSVDATRESGEPNHGGLVGTSSVWYKWTAPGNGHALLDLTPSFQSAMAVYTGSAVGALARINNSDESHLTFDMVGGTTYNIAVDGFYPNEEGTFTLRWNCPVTTKPILDSPRNGIIIKLTKAYLHWEGTPCASYFQVVVREGSKVGPLHDKNTNLSLPEFYTSPLTPGQTYFWRIKACSAFQCKASVWRFFTAKK